VQAVTFGEVRNVVRQTAASCLGERKTTAISGLRVVREELIAA